ncbi:MAG TPA: DUF4252 domain-containing protein [Bacteroidales bacterium]|nr:DUF4252 domain-containing protein [Bacteroidales bacterium]
MKRLLLIIALTVTATFVYGQKSIDALFEKYAGKDGFVTITINGNLLDLARCLDDDDDDDDDDALPLNITEIRLLVQDDDNMKVDNFYDMVIKGIKLNDYEEFMRVKESDQDLRMLVRAEGKKFTEFLLIGGGEDNLLIQIKGEMTFNEAKKFSNDAKKNHGLNMVADRK